MITAINIFFRFSEIFSNVLMFYYNELILSIDHICDGLCTTMANIFSSSMLMSDIHFFPFQRYSDF